MAYKFQLGAATLSGSLTQEGDITGEGDLTLKNNGDIGCAADADLITLANQAVSFASDADVTINKAGGLNLADGAVTSTAAELNLVDGSSAGTVVNSKAVIYASDGQINGGVISGSGALQGASVAVDGAVVASDFDVASAGNVTLFDTVGGNNLTLGASSTTVVVAGDLQVNGATVTIDSATITVTSSISFEGSVDDGNELKLTTANPTADRTVTLPDLSGHVPLLAGAIGNANVTAAEFLLLDGGSTVNTATVADGDAVLFNDAGTMKQLNVTSLKTYFQTGVTATTAQGLRLNGANATVASNITASNDVLLVDSSAARTIEMPDITADDIGQLYMIKDIAGNAATNNITITESASNHDIDGSTSIVIESDSGAVMLLACSASNGFFYSIF